MITLTTAIATLPTADAGAGAGNDTSPTLVDIDAALASIAGRIANCDATLAAHADARPRIDCHPHHHWWTSGALAVAMGLDGNDILAMAGLLALPWPEHVAALRAAGGAGFLLRRWPAMIADDRSALEDAGREVLAQSGLLVRGQIPSRWQREPKFGCGAAFVSLGFDVADRDAWSGVWTLGLRAFERRCNLAAWGSCSISIGSLLAPMVAADRDALAQRGARSAFLRAQATYQDDCLRFARWQTANPDHPWPRRIAGARQGQLVRTTAKLLDTAHPALATRGQAAAWLSSHGANLRFTKER